MPGFTYRNEVPATTKELLPSQKEMRKLSVMAARVVVKSSSPLEALIFRFGHLLETASIAGLSSNDYPWPTPADAHVSDLEPPWSIIVGIQHGRIESSVHANDFSNNTPEDPLRVEILPHSLEPSNMLYGVSKI